jgi:hypothetical protein
MKMFKVSPLTEAKPCRVCGEAGALVCPTRQGESIVLCMNCARDLGRLWVKQNGD